MATLARATCDLYFHRQESGRQPEIPRPEIAAVARRTNGRATIQTRAVVFWHRSERLGRRLLRRRVEIDVFTLHRPKNGSILSRITSDSVGRGRDLLRGAA